MYESVLLLQKREVVCIKTSKYGDYLLEAGFRFVAKAFAARNESRGVVDRCGHIAVGVEVLSHDRHAAVLVTSGASGQDRGHAADVLRWQTARTNEVLRSRLQLLRRLTEGNSGFADIKRLRRL